MEPKKTLHNKKRRQSRIRARVRGSAERPRLTVTISNRNVQAQLIDDEKQHTIAASSTVNDKSTTGTKPGTLREQAVLVGKDIAKKAKKAKVVKVVFDRNGRRYHGRIADLADAARKEGLEF